MSHPTDGDDGFFQSQSDEFITWFLGQSGASINPRVALKDLRSQDAGRGIVALGDIGPDEILFVVPRPSLITAETSDLAIKAPGILSGLDPWLSFTLVLIYEFNRGTDSPWKHYFDLLPPLDTLMFWSDEELAELQGSAVVQKIGKADADKNFETHLLPRIKAHATLFHPSPSVIDEAEVALAHRMASIILAYAFDLDNDDGSATSGTEDDKLVEDDSEEVLPKAIVPLADMLNADADRNNAHLVHGEHALTMKALIPIKKGEQIFNDYGPLPRSDLLRRYGYITDNYTKYDVVDIPASIVIEQVLAERHLPEDERETRLEFLDDHGFLDDGYDLSHPTAMSSAFPDDLIILVRTLLLPNDRLVAAKEEDRLPKAIKLPEVASALRRCIDMRLLDYATTVEQDRIFLQQPPLSRRARQAIDVRLGEKVILQEALHELTQDFTADERSRKRTKERQDFGDRKKAKTG